MEHKITKKSKEAKQVNLEQKEKNKVVSYPKNNKHVVTPNG